MALGDELLEVKQAGGQGQYLLGTDKVGRDILSRIIYGSRISVIVAGIAIFISGAIGATLESRPVISGAGWTRSSCGWWIFSLSIPIILMALVLVTALGASYQTIVIVLVIFLWAQYARQATGRDADSARAGLYCQGKGCGLFGCPDNAQARIPNVFNSLVVLATLQVGFVIILEASLSFLGAGIPRPNPAWGPDGV